jgi:signal peptidase I
MTFIRLCLIIGVSYSLFKWVLIPIRIHGPSMEPNYHHGRINVANKLAYRWRAPRRGDVVCIRFAGPHIMLLKRIIGLPGECVAIHRGTVFIDGKPLAEPYVLRPKAPWERAEVCLGAQEYFVIGDNREMRIQSHQHGEVQLERIVGKVMF